MQEVEIKVPNIDKNKIIQEIEKLGAVKNFTGRVCDYRYDTENRSLSKQGKVLRIRQKGKYTFLNFKGKKDSENQIMKREELGVRVSNLKVLQKIITEIGFIRIFDLKKYRSEYCLDDIIFDIDEYPGLPPMLEIESNDGEKVEKYLKILNIDKEGIKRVYIEDIIKARKESELKKKIKESLS